MDVKRSARKWAALFLALGLYFVIHEGSHAIYALLIGGFKEVRFLGVGLQVDIYRESMTDFQLGMFCLTGNVMTLFGAYVMCFAKNKIVKSKSLLFRAVCYYLTLILLLMDSAYLMILYRFVGGGDMNGIVLLFPEKGVQVVCGLLLAFNTIIWFRYVLPCYSDAYGNTVEREKIMIEKGSIRRSL